MTEPEQTSGHKKRSHWLRNTFFIVSGLFILGFWGLFFSFNYFGDKLLRKYLQEKVLIASKGLYQIHFSRMNLNILNGNISLKDFELFPDTLVYQRLKSEGKINKALYKLSVSSMSIHRLHLILAYRQRRLIASELKIVRPKIWILAYPDTLRVRKNRFNLIYEDIYPLVRQVFNDFHIDSVKVEHGNMLSSGTPSPGRIFHGEYEFSASLRNVSINAFSYYNKQRVFYSTDIDLIIHNFEYSLADSLYFIRAGEVGFSLTRSRLYGKNLSLKPNFRKKQLYQIHNGDFYQLSLPSFSIDGINLYEALTDRKVQVGKVKLEKFSLQVFRNSQAEADHRPGHKRKKKIRVADLFTVISGELKSVAIDSVLLKKASFEFFQKPSDPNPEMRIAEVNLSLSGFLLDSLAYRNKEKIFYSSDIDLELNDFSLMLRDQIHTLNASRIRFSTLQKRIEVQDAIISPDQIRNMQMGLEKKNTVSFLLPGMVFYQIDLKKVFNRRILDFDRLVVNEPDLKFIQFHKPKNMDPRFGKPKDFFEEENNEVIYDLLKKYLFLIRGNEIRIARGFFEFDHNFEGIDKKMISASFDLQIQDVLIDSAHGMNQQGYFFSRDFDLDVHSLNYLSPDSLDHFRASRIHVATRDSLIEAFDLGYIRTVRPVMEVRQSKIQALSIDFSLQKLLLTGLNHKKLFLDKVLKAREILFDNPVLRVKAEKPKAGSEMMAGPAMKKPETPVRTFEIVRMKVKKGSFSYDGSEDLKATYFSLRDIDFGLLNAMVHIPEKGAHDGLIRFDSLQLSVFPFRAVIADSAYALECKSLHVFSYPVNITAEGLRLTPLKDFDPHFPEMLITTDVPLLKLTGFYFDRAIFDKTWLFDQIEAVNPVVSAEWKKEKRSSGGGMQLPSLMKSLKISSILVSNAGVGLKIHANDSVSSYRLKGVRLNVTNFALDSLIRSRPDPSHLFNAEDISLSARGFSWVSGDSLYAFSLGGFGLSTRSKKAWFDTLSMLPRYSKAEFSQKKGYQTDRMEVRIPRIELDRLDYLKLLHDSILRAGSLSIKGFDFQDYRDKRLPFPEWQRPLMPLQAIDKIRFPFMIDTVRAENGFAAYEEQTGDEPGRIFFDSLAFLLCNFTNRPTVDASMDVHSTSRLMGKAPIDARFHFLLEHPRDSFTFIANMGALNLRDINPMLSKLMPVTIRNGIADKTQIRYFHANDSLSRGILDLQFRNLDISLDPTREDFLHKMQMTLETILVNWILTDNNPNDEGKFRQGIICFDRDMQKGFFNFIWKSTLSGIKSSAGFNTKAQRVIGRAEKKRKK